MRRTSAGRRTRFRRVVTWCGSIVTLIALQIAVGAPAALAVTCTLINHQATIAPESSDVTVIRAGTILKANDIPCGSVTQIDTVHVDMGNHDLTFDLSGGPFAPGFTTEGDGVNASEIEFDVTNPSTSFPGVAVLGTAGVDRLSAGTRTISGPETVGEINLNGQADGSHPDADVQVHSTSFGIVFSGLGGPDFLSGRGTGANGSKHNMYSMTFYDGPGGDEVRGGDGFNSIYPPTTPDPGDLYLGGPGFDFLDYTINSRTADQTISQDGISDDGATNENDNVGADIDRINTWTGSDTLVGGPGRQILDAGAGNNDVSGGPGNDLMVARDGQDVFHGGAGFDSVSYGFSTAGVVVTVNGAGDDGIPGEHDNVEPDVEEVFGSSHNDMLTGNPKRNRLNGVTGNDSLLGLDGNDVLVDGGSDPLTGGGIFTGDDEFQGGGGRDTFVDTDHADFDLDLSLDDVANDVVLNNPNQGIDNVHSDIENVVAGDGDDFIKGSSAANRLVGGDGNDNLLGVGGKDTLLPGPGTDHVFGGAAKDTASFAGAATGIIASLDAGTANGEGFDTLTTMEALTGSGHDDTLTGDEGPNTLKGGKGPDHLNGLAGNDLLIGGAGNDALSGGPDIDTCKQGTGSGPSTGCEH